MTEAPKWTTQKQKWTHFHDMSSGGGKKLEWRHIYIEAPEAEARRVFESRFGRDPDNVTCGCCGADYSITEADSFWQISAYERGCGYDGGDWIERDAGEPWRKYIPLSEYVGSAPNDGSETYCIIRGPFDMSNGHMWDAGRG